MELSVKSFAQRNKIKIKANFLECIFMLKTREQIVIITRPTKNKANLRDLITATSLVILPKLD